MKIVLLACTALVATAFLAGCSGEEAMDPKDSMADQLKAAHINPNGPPAKGGALKKTTDKPAETPATGKAPDATH